MSDKTNFDLVLVVISSRGPIYDQFMKRRIVRKITYQI